MSQIDATPSPNALTSYHTFHTDLPPSNVPEDYNRFHPSLKPSSFPENKIVGLLACQRDPYLRELKGVKITAARIGKVEKNPRRDGGKKKGKGSGTEDKEDKQKDDGEVWEIELEDTVLFPEGGGQPNDTGFLTILNSSSVPLGLKVVNVQRKGLNAVHIVSIPSSLSTTHPELKIEDVLKPGNKADLKVDWERRWDHMTHHTAQHLLSALCETHLSLPTLSWALPAHPSLDPCYIELPRGLTQKEIDQIESLSNQLVSRNWGADEGLGAEHSLDKENGKTAGDKRVWIESRLQNSSTGVTGTSTPITEGSTDVAKEMEGLGLNDVEHGDRESRGLPKDYAGGVIRTAVIEGVDRSVCLSHGRTHQQFLNVQPHSQPFLSKIQIMHIMPTTAAKPSPKPTRLYMLAGARAHRHLLQTSRQLTSASVPLGCSRPEVPDRIAQRMNAIRESTRLEGRLREALAMAEGKSVNWNEGEDGIWRAVVERKEESTHAFDFLQSLSNAAVDALASRIKKTSAEVQYVLVLLSIPDPVWVDKTHAAAGTFCQITSNPPDLAKTVGDEMKAGLDGLGVKGRVKGGGAKGKFMGKVAGEWTAKEKEAAFPKF